MGRNMSVDVGDDDFFGTVGFVAKYREPSRPFSSPVTRRTAPSVSAYLRGV